ncbi:MAG TPA: hypothetical protein VJL27_01300 [Patescibacteria group bacterium]|nr:hypothetical protein [Patescibacteria group bacterium]
MKFPEFERDYIKPLGGTPDSIKVTKLESGFKLDPKSTEEDVLRRARVWLARLDGCIHGCRNRRFPIHTDALEHPTAPFLQVFVRPCEDAS